MTDSGLPSNRNVSCFGFHEVESRIAESVSERRRIISGVGLERQVPHRLPVDMRERVLERVSGPRNRAGIQPCERQLAREVPRAVISLEVDGASRILEIIDGVQFPTRRHSFNFIARRR